MNEALIPLTVEPVEEGGYLATSPVWDDLLAQGRTIAETLEIAQDVARRLIESYLEHGDPLPDVVQQLMLQNQLPFYERPLQSTIADCAGALSGCALG
jgi:predicted RNase H-like HicB family nuclease